MRRAVLIFLILLTGCGKDELPNPHSMQISVSGYMEPTRTSISGTTTSFVSSDRIGVTETLTTRRNVLFTYNGSTWSTTTPMYWYNASATHTFYGYYPYNSSYNGMQAALPILANQTIATTPDVNSDMLVAGPKTQTRNTGTNVPLQFRHAFSLLQFNITMGVLNTWTIKTMTIQGGNTAGGTANYGLMNTTNSISLVSYNLSSGGVSVASANNNSTVFSQTLTKSIPSVGLLGVIPVTVYAFVLPGQYANPVPGIRFTLTPLIGSDKTTTLVSLPNTTFAANTKYVYNVQIGGGILTSAPALSGVSEQPLPLKITSNQFNTYLL